MDFDNARRRMIDVLKKQSKPYLEKILEFNIIIYDYQMGLIKKEIRNGLFYESKERSFLKVKLPLP
jgi:hypothetical protein